MRAEEEQFKEFNFKSEGDEDFDELFRKRDDFARVIKAIGTTCGG